MTKPPIKEKKDTAIDVRLKETEILSKQKRVEYEEGEILMKKIEVLTDALRAVRPATSVGAQEWELAIADEFDRSVIKNKMLELVKKL